MLMPFSSSASQIDVPAGALMSRPVGQYSGCGMILMMGMVST
jgi:hypothetical protein